MFTGWRIKQNLSRLNSPDAAEREKGLLNLARLKAHEARGEIQKRLVDVVPKVRMSAAKALQELGDLRWQPLVAQYEGGYCKTLASSGRREEVELLLGALADPYADQLHAAAAASQVPEPWVREQVAEWATADRLQQLFKKGYWAQCLILKVVAGSNDPVIAKMLFEAIAATARGSRDQLFPVFCNAMAQTAADVLARAAMGSDKWLGDLALEAIKHLGEAGKERLIQILEQSPKPGRLRLAVGSLPGIAKKKSDEALAALPALLQGLSDDSSEVREKCAALIGKCGPMAREAIPKLVQIVRQNNPADCRKALQALKKLGHDDPYFYFDCYRQPDKVAERLIQPGMADGPDAPWRFQRGYTVILDTFEGLRPSSEGRFSDSDLEVAEKAIEALEALIRFAGRRHFTQPLVHRILNMKDVVSPPWKNGHRWEPGIYLTTRNLKHKLREAFGKAMPQPVQGAGETADEMYRDYFTSPRIQRLVAQLEEGVPWQNERTAAEKALIALKDRRAIPLLIALLEKEMFLLRTVPNTNSHDNITLRSACDSTGKILGELGAVDELLFLFRKAKSEHPNTRFRVMLALSTHPQNVRGLLTTVQECLDIDTDESRSLCHFPLANLSKVVNEAAATMHLPDLRAILSLPDAIDYTYSSNDYGYDYVYDHYETVGCRPIKQAAQQELNRREASMS
jgi:HEAT repeat protein